MESITRSRSLSTPYSTAAIIILFAKVLNIALAIIDVAAFYAFFAKFAAIVPATFPAFPAFPINAPTPKVSIVTPKLIAFSMAHYFMSNSPVTIPVIPAIISEIPSIIKA